MVWKLLKKIHFNQRVSGFTLIELLIVVVITVILLAIAIPNYARYIANETASSLAVELSSTFRLAREEAIRRGMTTQICAINTAGNTASCNATAANWQYGWTISAPSTSTLIQVYTPKGAQFVTISPTSSIVFSSIGLILPNKNFVFTIKPTGCSRGYSLTVTINGEIQTQQISCP